MTEKKPTKKRNREREFLVQLKNSLIHYEGVFWHKIEDSPVYHGMKTRFNKPKPFDAFMIYKTVPIAIEAKYLSGYQAFGMRHLQDSQIKGLEDFVKAGGQSYIFLNIWEPRKVNRLLIFDWIEFRERKSSYKKAELEAREYGDFVAGSFPVKNFLKNAYDWGLGFTSTMEQQF